MRTTQSIVGRFLWKYAVSPALSILGGRALLTILAAVNIDLVAIVQDNVPLVAEQLSSSKTVWILAFVIGTMIYSVGYYFLFRKNAAPSFADAEIVDSDPWDDLQAAAQHCYNELTSGRFNDAGQLRQAMTAFDGLWGGVSGWIVDGIRRDIIKARGVCERRSIAELVPPTIKGVLDNNYPDGTVEDQDGLTWRITEIHRQSLDEYLEELGRDDDA